MGNLTLIVVTPDSDSFTEEEMKAYAETEGAKYATEFIHDEAKKIFATYPSINKEDYLHELCGVLAARVAEMHEELLVLRKSKADIESKGR